MTPTQAASNKGRHRAILAALLLLVLMTALGVAAALQPTHPNRFQGAAGVAINEHQTEPTWWLDPIIEVELPEPEDVDSAPDLEPEPARVDVMIPGDALFPSGSASLSEQSSRSLIEVAESLNGRTILAGTIVCHTDDIGSDSENLELSTQRAATLLADLASHGIDTANITTSGLGEADPAFDNSTESGRARNRRCEIQFELA